MGKLYRLFFAVLGYAYINIAQYKINHQKTKQHLNKKTERFEFFKYNLKLFYCKFL